MVRSQTTGLSSYPFYSGLPEYLVDSAETNITVCDLTAEICSNKCGEGFQTFFGKCGSTSITWRTFTINCRDYSECKGGWGSWTPFGECFSTYDKSIQLYTRKCDNPVPGRNATYCDGDSVKNESCISRGCPGSWSCWEDDGHCSNTCGNGTQIRRRRCDNPAPTIYGDECPGENVTNVHCNMKECPVYKWGHLKELNLTKDDLKEIMKEELNEMKSNLTIDSTNISASIRKHISARDDRPSAASVGYIGVALLLIPLMIIICFDASKFFAMIAKILKRVCSRKSAQITNAHYETD
ncbi:unnamed protein product [Mytilus edulis]|uniref:HMCN n=1 Tax=Mytilus edulis TaxID=6550 RepID=A0A8S3TQV8_MYTED|nr:unnamed protein product [Mytilus edulis]